MTPMTCNILVHCQGLGVKHLRRLTVYWARPSRRPRALAHTARPSPVHFSHAAAPCRPVDIRGVTSPCAAKETVRIPLVKSALTTSPICIYIYLWYFRIPSTQLLRSSDPIIKLKPIICDMAIQVSSPSTHTGHPSIPDKTSLNNSSNVLTPRTQQPHPCRRGSPRR